MKTFKIYAVWQVLGYIKVDANSLEEAYVKAKNNVLDDWGIEKPIEDTLDFDKKRTKKENAHLLLNVGDKVNLFGQECDIISINMNYAEVKIPGITNVVTFNIEDLIKAKSEKQKSLQSTKETVE